MSAKIYEGVKFVSDNIYDIYKSLMGLRDKCIDIGVNHLLSDDYIGTIKSYMLFEQLYYQNASKIVHLIQREFDKQYRSHSAPSFLFEIIIYPHSSGQFFGTYFTDRIPEYRNLLFARHVVEDFHYQNQSDIPDGISDEEWGVRKKIWDDIFDHGDSFSEKGMIVKIVQSKHMFYNKNNISRIYHRIEELKQSLQNEDSKNYKHMWE